MKTRWIVAAGVLAVFSMPLVAQAQGIVRGGERGAAEGGRAAGPVGAAVGGVVGGMAGGVVGGARCAGNTRPSSPRLLSSPPPELLVIGVTDDLAGAASG